MLWNAGNSGEHPLDERRGTGTTPHRAIAKVKLRLKPSPGTRHTRLESTYSKATAHTKRSSVIPRRNLTLPKEGWTWSRWRVVDKSDRFFVRCNPQ